MRAWDQVFYSQTIFLEYRRTSLLCRSLARLAHARDWSRTWLALRGSYLQTPVGSDGPAANAALFAKSHHQHWLVTGWLMLLLCMFDEGTFLRVRLEI